MLGFAETAQFSFQSGPERIRKYARLFSVVTNVLICFVHFQAAVIYILYVATSFQQVWHNVLCRKSNDKAASWRSFGESYVQKSFYVGYNPEQPDL